MGRMQDEAVAETEEFLWHATMGQHPSDDPLLDCLVVLAKLENRPISKDSLRAGLPLADHLTLELFPRAAARAGLTARTVRRPLRKISNLVLPAILLLKNGQACVAVDIDHSRGEAKILLPESGAGERTLALPMLDKLYLGYTIFVRPQFMPDNRVADAIVPETDNWFWSALAKSWRVYRDVFAASLLLNVFSLATPFFILNVYDRVVPNDAMETLWVLAIGISIIYVFDVVMRGMRAYFLDLAGKRTDVTLSAQLMEKVLGLKAEARPQSVGAFARNMQDFESVRDFFTSATLVTLIDLPFVVLTLLAIWYIGGVLVTVLLAGLPLILIYALSVYVPLKHSVENTVRASAQKNATLVESLTGAEAIKVLGAEGQVQKVWEEAVTYIANWGVRARLLSNSVANWSMFIQHLSLVGVVVLGVYLIKAGELSMGGLIACVILSRRALAPMAQVANLATRYHRARAVLRTLDRMMLLPIERPSNKSFVSRPVLHGTISFRDVGFAYPGAQQPVAVLRGVSFDIQPGEHVAIVGPTGSGKTTLGKLMLGLYEPTEGAITIDGIDVRQIDPADLRRHMGYVPQDVMLFYGTLRENILLGAPYVDDEVMLRAAELSGVTRFASRHPLGFDMPVGERGTGLSGGQRQAVAMARALLLEPPIMLLDEPSSSMDNGSEWRLKQSIDAYLPGKTLLLITHRASLLELVDRIIVLDGGKIVADGAKDEILESLKQGKIVTAG